MRVLLDTNIYADILLERPFDQDRLQEIGAMAAFGDVELWVSAKSFTDAFYIMRKTFKSDAIQQSFEKSFDLLRICSVDEADVKEAVSKRWADFEDCLIDVCARKIKADYLITRDRAGFDQSRIRHGSAEDFMKYVKDTLNIEYAIVDM